MPDTLCHGDFHTGNLLLGPTGEWIWADWQEVRLAPGVDDLAFFWQRAFAAVDTPPPHDAMVEAYVAGLATVKRHLISREQVDQALAWAELRSWLVDWPGYLGALPTARMVRVLRRIETLMSRLELGSCEHGAVVFAGQGRALVRPALSAQRCRRETVDQN